MNTRRAYAIYIALCSFAAITTACMWVAATGSFHPPWWAILTSSAVICLGCDLGTDAIVRWRARPERVQRRTHARSNTASPKENQAA